MDTGTGGSCRFQGEKLEVQKVFPSSEKQKRSQCGHSCPGKKDSVHSLSPFNQSEGVCGGSQKTETLEEKEL